MTRPLPQAVLLDLDDTILDDSSNVVQCWREACVAHRAAMHPVDPDALFEAVERIRAWYWSDPDRHRVGRLDLGAARCEVVRLALADLGVDDPALAGNIATWYAVQRDLGMQPFADAVTTVQWLREQGCRLALLTNGSAAAQRTKVDRFGLAGLFDLILIEGELGYGKPDARVYRLALETLGVAPAGTWMAGDNLEWDVAAPQRLGILGIWVDVRGLGLRPERGVRPDRIVRSLAELRFSPESAQPG